MTNEQKLQAQFKLAMRVFALTIKRTFNAGMHDKDINWRHMAIKDFADLRRVYECIEAGDLTNAWRYASLVETAVRDEIPKFLWDLMRDKEIR
jgi:hypothetical protein